MVYFLGARPYDFKDDSGRQVSGVTVWFCDNEQESAYGVIPFKTSLSYERFITVFGSKENAAAMAFHPVAAQFNRWGKPESVQLLKEKQ